MKMKLLCLLKSSNFSLFNHRWLSSSSPTEKPHFVVDYLVKSCGLSPEKATKAARKLSHLKSTSKPDSVLQFLRNTGLGDAEIRAAVSSYPFLLCSDPERTLEPRVTQLQKLGLSPSQISQLVSLDPKALYKRKLHETIQFYESTLGSVDRLLTALKRNPWMVHTDHDKIVSPNIQFLQECGLSASQIGYLVSNNPRFLTQKLVRVKDMMQRVKDLEIPLSPGILCQALTMVSSLSRSTVDSKLITLKGFGWSQAEIASMIKKQPAVLSKSEECIRTKVEFLTKEVGWDLSIIARHPTILGTSLEKKLIPRHYVMRCLQSKGLPQKELSFYSAIILSDLKFKERFILPFKEVIPGLVETYDAAVAGKAPIHKHLLYQDM